MKWRYAPASPFTGKPVAVFRELEDGRMESRSLEEREVQEWLAKGNKPEAAPSESPKARTRSEKFTDMFAAYGLTPADFKAEFGK